uniref:DUF5641 domain-containing protein n=1 Tax=Heterorhabditis bacteriophora TaxID=37862 RepID=A0A1I7XDD7_HETBA
MTYSASHKIKWLFNPPGAPWMGGTWERLIGSVKKAFRKAIGRKRLSFIEIYTVMTRIEAIINCRPLTKIDMDDMSKEIADSFWIKWTAEYLTALRDTHKINYKQRRHRTRVSEVGEIVLIENELLPRGQWSIGKMVENIKSADGLVRSAKVLTANGKVLIRSIIKLFPLEIRTKITETKEKGVKNLDISDEEDSDSESYKPHQMSNISESRLQTNKQRDTRNQRQERRVHPRFGEMRKDVRTKSLIAMALLCITLCTHMATEEAKAEISSNHLNCGNEIVSVKPHNKDIVICFDGRWQI